jgi:hypothetical protein
MTGGSSLWADAIAADAAAALLGFTTKCPATVAATLSRLLLSPFCSMKCISVASRGPKCVLLVDLRVLTPRSTSNTQPNKFLQLVQGGANRFEDVRFSQDVKMGGVPGIPAPLRFHGELATLFVV